MGIREVIQLINFEFKTDKLVEIKKTSDNGASIEANGASRSFSIDFNIKKALALLGIYVGVLNANMPSEVIKVIQIFIGG